MYCHFQGFLITSFLQLIDSIFHYDFQLRLKQKLFFSEILLPFSELLSLFCLSFPCAPLALCLPKCSPVPLHFFWNSPFHALFDTGVGFC